MRVERSGQLLDAIEHTPVALTVGDLVLVAVEEGAHSRAFEGAAMEEVASRSPDDVGAGEIIWAMMETP